MEGLSYYIFGGSAGVGEAVEAGCGVCCAGGVGVSVLSAFFGFLCLCIFEPVTIPSVISILCTVGDGLAPTDIQYFTLSPFKFRCLLRGLYIPTSSTKRPLVEEFLLSATTILKKG